MAFIGEDDTMDVDILDALDSIGYMPTMDQQKKLMGSFENFEEREAQEALCRPKAAFLGSKFVQGETMFAVRLSLPKREDRLWYFKKYGDLAELEENLKQDAEQRGWGEHGAVNHLPELPPDEKLGIRRRLSMLGLNDFIAKQQDALQKYMDALLVQLPEIRDEPRISQFFSLNTVLDVHRGLLDEAIAEAGADVTMERMAGYWRLKGSQHVWTLEKSGKALLDGKHRGEEFDMRQTGQGGRRRMFRQDGWQVDLELSDANLLIWHKEGHLDLEWVRDSDEHAQMLLKKCAAKRLAAEMREAAKKV